MGILKTIFSNKGALDAAKGVGKFIDEQNLTEQEARELQLTLASSVMASTNEHHPFAHAQRALAFMVGFAWCFIILNIVVAIWIKALWPEIDALTGLLKLALSNFVIVPTSSVFGLFFMGGTINSWKNKDKS